MARKTTEPKYPRFLINPNKIAPHNAIGVGDWVAFDLFDGDCKIGEIIGFEMNDYTTETTLAVIQMPSGKIARRNIFRDLADGALFKVDHDLVNNIQIIKED